jgi:hypothetical protein
MTGSSLLKKVSHDAQMKHLDVVFLKEANTIFRYEGVPIAIYKGLLAAHKAGSAGRYFHVKIRNNYSHSKL